VEELSDALLAAVLARWEAQIWALEELERLESEDASG
jgi:hypothetical protein